MDSGAERIDDTNALDAVRRQAERVKAKTLVVAALLTALVVAIPW